MSNPVQKTFDVFVGNLPASISDDVIKKHFSQFGKINSWQLKPGNRSDNTNICFVRFCSQEEATNAIENSGQLQWEGASIHISAATRSGHSWYDGGRRSGDKKGHEGHQRNKAHVGHIGHRQPGASGDSKPESRKEHIMWCSSESPIRFWGQQTDRSVDLKDISDKLQHVGPSGQFLTGPPNKDKIYAAMFTDDGLWYRCRAVHVIDDKKVKVLFVDYGNTEIKEWSEIKELLPSLAAISPIAHMYCLFGLELIHDSDSMGYSQGVEMLEHLLVNKIITATLAIDKEAGAIPIIAETEDADVNQEMITAGFAVPTKKEQKGANLKVGQWIPELMSEPVSRVGQPNGNSSQNKPKQHKSRPQNNNHVSSNNNNYQQPSLGDAWNQGRLPVGDIERNTAVQEALAKAQQEAARMKQLKEAAIKESSVIKREWDSTVLELEGTKMKLKQIREEYTQLVLNHTKRSLSQRLTRLVQSVEKVKSYRIQFPTEDHCDDPLEKAFNVASSSNRIVTGELPIGKMVDNLLNIYKATQNAIRASENVEEVADLIAARDKSRRDLQVALNSYVTTAQQLPLSDRSAKVEEMLMVIKTTYADFLRKDAQTRDDVATFDEALAQYREWKTQKETEFQESRTRTNTCHNGVTNALRILQEQLSLDTAMCQNNLSTCAGLDQLFDGLQEAVDEEALKTNMVSDVNESDSQTVTTLVKVLEAELRRELGDIVHIRQLLTEYSSLAKTLEPWLEEKPSMEPIITVRKTIKTCKSKLRHKLADLQDLEEESEDSGNEDVIQLKEELAAIRLQLHKAFAQEDEILANLAELNEDHFPELNLQYPDLNIEVVKQYNGLLKHSRAIDQFDVTPMPNTQKKNIYKAVYCGKNCVLKEYIIDEGIGVKRSEFLRRASSYNALINPHILPIEAIFFTGAGRQAYVMEPSYQKNLTTLVSEGPLSMEQAYHILCKVLVGIQVLHSAKLVNGAVHPNNVLIGAHESVVLAEVDFSKTPQQRAASMPFTTSSRLKFQPPEFEKQEISWSSDMYNFGLLALWLHFPSYKFTLRPNGVPDFSALEMDPSLEQLLLNLLQEEPGSRHTPNSLWHLPYFSNSPHSRPSSPKASAEEATLQLRPKSEPRTGAPKNGNGILKNKGTTSPTSSPVLSPHTPQKNLVEVIEEITGEELLDMGRVHAGQFVNDDSTTSTPVLISSPQGTPLNTPAERESGSSSPPDGQQAAIDRTEGLVKTAFLQASQLADLQEDEEDGECIMSEGDDGLTNGTATNGDIYTNANMGTGSILDDHGASSIEAAQATLQEIEVLEAEIAAKSSALIASARGSANGTEN